MRTRTVLRAMGAGALLALGLNAGTAAAAAFTLWACGLEQPVRLTVVAAECGVLSVAKNPQDPEGRHIGLHVAHVPAISRRKQADPLFILAGGPGAAATAFYATVAGAFARIHRDRDIVLIDQRGTGESNPLDCEADEALLYRATDTEIAADTRRCLTRLSARADVAYYTSSLAVQDLERVRAALGVERINLYGTSSGTRVAQHYLRLFLPRVRAVILDGVVPAPLALGPATATDAEQALLSILARCAGESACRGRYGHPARPYHSVRALLRNHAVPVALADPSSGHPTRLTFTTAHLATVLRLASYTPEYAALLPLMLDDAAAHQDYAPLAAQFLLVERGYAEALATGMHNSVVCTEDVPFYDLRAIDRERLADTFLGTLQLDGLDTVCRIWPHGPIDADFHAPLASDVPALLLSGSDDPVTPPAFAALAARGFSRGLSIVLGGFGHGQLTAPCMDRVLAQFLARASVVGLDVSCTRRARPMPFFTSLNGPPP